MDSTYLTNPAIFLIDTLASLYILAVVLRFLLQWCGADYYNPIAQFLVKLTHPPLRWLRRFVPPVGRIDTSSIILALGLQMLADFSILTLKNIGISIGALVILSLTQLISLLINIFIFAVFARALLSWINPGTFGAVTALLHDLTEPLLNVCRKFVPDLGGVDFSALVALVFLQLAKMVILPPLNELAGLIG